MDIRLDFIEEFENQDEAIAEMRACRQAYIELDRRLKMESEEAKHNPSLSRSLILARQLLEQSLFYAIKSLALKHEKKVKIKQQKDGKWQSL